MSIVFDVGLSLAYEGGRVMYRQQVTSCLGEPESAPARIHEILSRY
jgi:hypothetical protein